MKKARAPSRAVMLTEAQCLWLTEMCERYLDDPLSIGGDYMKRVREILTALRKCKPVAKKERAE